MYCPFAYRTCFSSQQPDVGTGGGGGGVFSSEQVSISHKSLPPDVISEGQGPTSGGGGRVVGELGVWWGVYGDVQCVMGNVHTI